MSPVGPPPSLPPYVYILYVHTDDGQRVALKAFATRDAALRHIERCSFSIEPMRVEDG